MGSIFSGGSGGAGDATEAKQDTAQAAIDKIPKSDSTVSWNATALGAINAEVDTALNTVIPASNTANSANDVLLDQLAPRIPGAGTIATTADLVSAGTIDFNATTKNSIQTAATASLTADNLDHLSLTTDGANNYPNTVAAGTVLAKIISKVAAGATPSGFDNTTDSLEALSDKLGTPLIYEGTLTTSSATGPADTVAGGLFPTGHFNGCILVIAAGTYIYENAIIDVFTTTTGVFTLRSALTTAPGLVKYAILPRPNDVNISLVTHNLDHLAGLTDGANNYPNTVVNGSILAKLMTKTAAGGDITDFDNTTDSLEAIADVAIAIKAKTDLMSLPKYHKDFWCAAPTNTAVITTPGAEWALPNVVVPAAGTAEGLPAGATCVVAHLLLMFDPLNTSAAANYIETSGDGIYFKISTETHYAHLVAYESVAGDWHALASSFSPGQAIEGVVNLVNATYGVTVTGEGTYNILSPETTESLAKAITAHGATMVLKNLRVGLRLYYTV